MSSFKDILCGKEAQYIKHSKLFNTISPLHVSSREVSGGISGGDA